MFSSDALYRYIWMNTHTHTHTHTHTQMLSDLWVLPECASRREATTVFLEVR